MSPIATHAHFRMMASMKRSWIVALLVLVATAQAADVGISPARLELTASPGATTGGTVTVLTTSASAQQIATEVNDWTLDIFGELDFRDAGTVEFSASTWLDVDIPEFVLAPGGSQDVRLEFAIPDDPNLAGTYHTVLFFTVVTPAADTGPLGVTTTTRIGLTVYVTIAGTEQAEAEIVDFFDLDERTLALVVYNGGNTLMRLGGAIELRDEAGGLARSLPVPAVPVMRDSEREVRIELPDDLDPGFYVLLALIEDGRGNLLVGELLLDVP